VAVVQVGLARRHSSFPPPSRLAPGGTCVVCLGRRDEAATICQNLLRPNLPHPIKGYGSVRGGKISPSIRTAATEGWTLRSPKFCIREKATDPPPKQRRGGRAAEAREEIPILRCLQPQPRLRGAWTAAPESRSGAKNVAAITRCGREETQSDTCQESSVRAVGSAVSSNIPAIPLSSDISASFPPACAFCP